MNALIPVDYSGERVLTTEQLAQAYGCSTDNIKHNFSNNKEHFEEGKHFFKLEGDELKDLRGKNIDLQISPMTRTLYLWTRRGASRHSKMLGTDKAWEMFDSLEENYFNPRPKQLTPAEQMAQGLLAAQQLLAERDATIAQLQPKAHYTDTVLTSKDTMRISQIAKDYGLTATRMNALLHGLRIIYKVHNQWLPYQEYANEGYTDTITFAFTRPNGHLGTSPTTVWTQKGRLFLYNKLKENGILPLSERNEEEI